MVESMIRKKEKSDVFTGAVRLVLILLFVFNFVMMLIAALDRNNSAEASIGSFGTKDFNMGWVLTYNGTSSEISLPMYVDASAGDEIVISNTLPSNLSNGMSLMVRASMEDVVVIIDGRMREEYSTNSVPGMGYYIPSAYVVVQIDEHDSGKPITIQYTVKTKGRLNEITIGHGNNVWFGPITSNLVVNLSALMVFVCGIFLTLAALTLGRRYRTDAAGYLGLLVLDVAMWMFSESAIRQIIFSRPSMSSIFSYITLELIGALACMYFDEVQHRVYHRRYVIAEAVCALGIVINLVLYYTGVCELYVTLPFMHVIEGVCAVLIIINTVSDVRSGRIRSYRISMIGGLFFITLSFIELSRFYFSEFVIFGGYVCIGLIGLMIATVMQTIHDVIAETREHEQQRTKMMNSTLETIAGAIDARDEYTGGHSERVGLYAGLLAGELAADHGFTDEDVRRIHYIGLVHDIGKIGVADSVLNKAGKLTNEEFSLMKRHTEIGYELMNSMGAEIEGILEGIRFHHERYDGKGYPDGLAGEDIPLVARILCLADSYDAMTSNRVYRKRLTAEEVRNELVRCSGSQFDPKLTEVFLRLLDRGDLAGATIEGMAVNREGVVTQSSMLEARLQSDLLEGLKIIHPSHVRMLCYMIKLREKKGTTYQVLFAGPADESLEGGELTAYMKKLSNAIADNITGHDIAIRYSDRLNVIALWGEDQGLADDFRTQISDTVTDVSITDEIWIK